MTALELADAMLEIKEWNKTGPKVLMEQAAAELRRLHEENKRCKQVCAATAEGWREDRDALLEALKNIDREFRKHGRQHWPEAVKARVAIAKAEETK